MNDNEIDGLLDTLFNSDSTSSQISIQTTSEINPSYGTTVIQDSATIYPNELNQIDSEVQERLYEDVNSSLSDNDINDILADNGFTDIIPDEERGDYPDYTENNSALSTEDVLEAIDGYDEVEDHHPELNETWEGYHSNSEISEIPIPEEYQNIIDRCSGIQSIHYRGNLLDIDTSTLNAGDIFLGLDDNLYVWGENGEAINISSENEVITSDVETTETSTSTDDAEIPLNSPTLLIDQATTRFSGAEWFNEIQKARVIIAGIGGIGSNVAFQLARMIPASITLYDDDNVERINMAGQLYSKNDIGKAKVDAIANMISAYTTMRQVYAIQGKFTEQTEPGDIMICGFDNMTARRTFFTSWLTHVNSLSKERQSKCLYIDGRLSMDTLQIFCIKGDDDYNINRYDREFLFTDSEAEATICSMKQTTYLACMIGSFMVNLFTNFIANQLNPIIPYDLPFFIEYEAQNMLFKTEN